VDEDVEVAGRPAALARVAAPAQADALAVGDARRHVDIERPAADLAPATVAALAGRLGGAPLAAADVAGDLPDDLPERRARHRLQDACAAAALARDDRRPGLGAVAVTDLAAVHRLEAERHRRAARGIGERDLGADGDVGALHRAHPSGPGPGPGAEAPAEAAAAEERLEEVGDRAEALEVRGEPALAQAVVAVAVVGGAPLGIREDLVGLGRLLELLLRVGIVPVDVGVQLAGEAPEGLLDARVVGAAVDAEHVVGIAGPGARHHEAS
jgi:hypothetical protein